MIDIRLATPADAQAIENFLASNTGETYRGLARSYVVAMHSSDFRKPIFAVACKNGEIIGTSAFSEEYFTVDVWGISWVNVRADHRNHGTGQRLVEFCLQEIKHRAGKAVTVILNTYPNKTRLYDKIGFVKAGHDHAGGSLMTKFLDAP